MIILLIMVVILVIVIIHIDLGLADDHGDDQDQTARWQLGDGPSHS